MPGSKPLERVVDEGKWRKGGCPKAAAPPLWQPPSVPRHPPVRQCPSVGQCPSVRRCLQSSGALGTITGAPSPGAASTWLSMSYSARTSRASTTSRGAPHATTAPSRSATNRSA